MTYATIAFTTWHIRLPPPGCGHSRWNIAKRWAIAAFFGLLLTPMLLLSLLTSQACGTLLSPSFYKERLREAEVYDFLYDDLLASAAREALESGDDLPSGVDLQADDVVSSVRDALPPDWLQEQVEAAIDSAGPYLLGDTDAFTLNVALDERSDSAENAAASLLDRVDLHEALFAEEVPEAVEKRIGEERELPLGITLTRDETVAAAERVVTPEHVRSQQSVAVDALAAYLVGKADTFEFTFSFSERTAALERELSQVLDDADLEGYLRRKVLEPSLDEHVTADVVMPLGIVVTRAEIRDAVNGAATPEWLRFEARRLETDIIPYLSARTDAFSVTVPLVDRTDDAISALSETVHDKYAALLAAVPQCTPEQLRQLARDRFVDLCVPPGFTAADFLWAVGINVEESLSGPVHEMTPDEFTFTEADLLEETLGTEAGEMIIDLRETMRDGITIDEEDIREALAEQDEGLPDALDTLREGFQKGWTWTEEDLRELVDDPEALDQARGAVGIFRILTIIVSLLSVGMVTGAGFIGGRSWGGRLGWAGGALAFAALIAFIIAGPLYGAVSSGPLEDARAEARATEDVTERILTTKLLDMAIDATDDVIGGMRLRSLLLVVLGAAGVAGGIALNRRRPARPPQDEAASTSEGEEATSEATQDEAEVDEPEGAAGDSAQAEEAPDAPDEAPQEPSAEDAPSEEDSDTEQQRPPSP
ncbi:MAG: hypothetical protein OXN15_02485 [Chloroflexota bacterium]|nr:hypothetical protein [Chloroflexota bacterium]MDE2968813.1 hypothetical protein [Chloroflexota bacterium]